MKSWPALNVCQLLLPGSSTVSAPLTTVMTSFCEVEKVYSPGAITPTVAGRVAVLKPMDLTLPSKYSFTFSMVMLRKKGAGVYHGIASGQYAATGLQHRQGACIMAIFRILSLDGGGVRGLLSATLLDQLEQRVPGWLHNVDMIAGTSTGGIIACGLGHGLTPADVCRFYYERMPKIFAESLLDDITDAGGLIGAQYSLKNLRRELKKVFGDTRLGQLRCRVVIPSFDL